MVIMAKGPRKREPGEKSQAVDCRKCSHYPKPDTTGKNEDFLQKTNNWTQSFCGEDGCEGKTYTEVNEQKKDSVGGGDTDGREENPADTDNLESEG